MDLDVPMHVIARMHSAFPTKFGIPRQSGLVQALRSTIVFEPDYRSPEALRGIEGFSHLWLIWAFSAAVRQDWSPTVRPPRLGGNVRMGVFATRSPFRPNPIGLSCVELLGVEKHPDWGMVLQVAGADLMDGTPILDIKPYVPYADCHPEAMEGFAPPISTPPLQVCFPERWRSLFQPEQADALVGVLSYDPRPSYQKDPDRVYGLPFAGYDVRFTVKDALLTVQEVVPIEGQRRTLPRKEGETDGNDRTDTEPVR